MYKLTRIGLLLSLLSLVYGETIHLWPNEVPDQTGEKAPHVHTPRWQSTRITQVTNPTLDIYLPVEGSANGAGIIICPGGGYQHLADQKEGHEIAKYYNTLGYTTFVLTYRVPQNQAGALQDAQRSLRYVRSHAQKWKLDKIGIMGFSAGGSLSMRLSTRYAEELYPQQDEIDLVSARPDFCGLLYPAYLDLGPGKTLTAELQLNAETPPVFLFITADDPFANGAIVMTQALANNKTPYELHMLPKGGHGYGMRPGKRCAEAWPHLFASWLSETLR